MTIRIYEEFEKNRQQVQDFHTLSCRPNDDQDRCELLDDKITRMLDMYHLPDNAPPWRVWMYKNARQLFEATKRFESSHDALETLRYVEGQLDMLMNRLEDD